MAPWQPGPTSPSALLHLYPPPSPLHQHPLLSNSCSKLRQRAGWTPAFLDCRRRDEVSEEQNSGWAGIHPGTRGRERLEHSSRFCLYFLWNPTRVSYMKLVPLLCQYVSVFVNTGRSHIAVESTTVPFQIHSQPSLWLHTPNAIANTIIRDLLKYHELKAGKS